MTQDTAVERQTIDALRQAKARAWEIYREAQTGLGRQAALRAYTKACDALELRLSAMSRPEAGSTPARVSVEHTGGKWWVRHGATVAFVASRLEAIEVAGALLVGEEMHVAKCDDGTLVCVGTSEVEPGSEAWLRLQAVGRAEAEILAAVRAAWKADEDYEAARARVDDEADIEALVDGTGPLFSPLLVAEQNRLRCELVAANMRQASAILALRLLEQQLTELDGGA